MSKAFLVCRLNPVTRRTFSCSLPAGGRLSDHFTLSENIYTEVNGLRVEDAVIREGDFISMTVVPMGDRESRKDLTRTGIILAVQVAAAFATKGMSSWAQIGITTAASVGASIGVNALIPPSPASFSASDAAGDAFNRLGALTGSRNQITPYGTVPRVYGKRKIYPPMSARPYTEIVANEQFLRLLFVLGEGPLHLSEPKIGDTIVGSFDADNKFTPNEAFQNLEIDVAEQPELYASQVNQQDPGASFTEDDDSAIRTTAPDAEEISIDLTFPQGLFVAGPNKFAGQHSVDFRIELRLVGETAWENIGGPANEITDGGRTTRNRGSSKFLYRATDQTYRALSDKRETLRVGLSWMVEPGQYEVRITRVASRPQEEDTQIFELANWTALRTIIHEEPTNMPGVVQIGLRIKATDQISGILDNFSVVAESRLAVYDGAAWSEPVFNPATGAGTGGAITSNPAWIMADILTGGQNARPIPKSRLNSASFKSFADASAADNRFCNIVFDSPRTVIQSAAIVGSTARGALAISDGTYTIIQDDEKTTPVQHFTPRNSWNFSSTRLFPDVPHALRVNFVNPEADWQTDEAVVYDDGYSLNGEVAGTEPATKFELLDLEGVTNWEHAWREGRFRLAEARLRPERYVIEADLENLVCERGDMVLATHDITLWGLKSGRVKSVSGSQIALDEAVIMEAGKTYNIRVRSSSGATQTALVETQAGEQTTVTTTEALSVAPGDLFMFGEAGTETQALKVLGVEPQSDFSARITLVDAAPEIYGADTGPIPDFDSNITQPPIEPGIRPPAPTITGIRADGPSFYLSGDRSPEPRILIDFEPGQGAPTQYIDAEVRAEDGVIWGGFASVEASEGTVSVHNVEDQTTYRGRIRARNGDLASAWVESDPVTVIANTVPETVTGFTAEFDRTQFRLKWDANPEPDIKEYEIRKDGTDWETAEVIGQVNATQFTLDFIEYAETTFRIKAINTAGIYSAEAAVSVVALGDFFITIPFPEHLYPNLFDDPALSLGRIIQNLEGVYTAFSVDLTVRLKKGVDYFIIVRSARRVIPITVTADRGPGQTTLEVEAQLIVAPAGSIIVRVPGQEEVEDSILNEQLGVLRDEKLPELQNNLKNLNDTALPGLAASQEQLNINITFLNETKLPALSGHLSALTSHMNQLNTAVLPGLDGKINENEAALTNLNSTVLPELNAELAQLDDILANPLDRGEFIEVLVSEQIFVDKLVANTIFTDTLAANTAFIDVLTANQIFTDSLVANEVFTDTLAANTAFINVLTANQIFTDSLVANEIFVEALVASQVFTDELVANTAFIETLAASQILADELVASQIFTDSLVANEVFTDALAANTAFINVLTANQIFTDSLAANTIFTDALSATTAFVDELTAQAAFIENIFASEATISNILTIGVGGVLRTENEETKFNADGIGVYGGSNISTKASYSLYNNNTAVLGMQRIGRIGTSVNASTNVGHVVFDADFADIGIKIKSDSAELLVEDDIVKVDGVAFRVPSMTATALGDLPSIPNGIIVYSTSANEYLVRKSGAWHRINTTQL